MSIVNKICKEVYPSTPEVNPNQSVTVYVPVATDSILGIAKFYSDHFVVVDGQVKLRGAWESILTAISDVNSAKEAAEAAKTASEAARTGAENAKNDAITAKTAAETAKNDAEAAKDAAIVAKNDAITAKDAAIAAKNDAVIAKAAIVASMSRVANAVKGVAKGSTIRIDDISPISHNMKVKVKPKNILPYPYTAFVEAGSNEVTINGVTFTNNGDGTITANGTATATTNLVLYDLADENRLKFDNSSLVLSGSIGGQVGRNKYYYLKMTAYQADGTETNVIQYSGSTKLPNGCSSSSNLQIVIISGKTVTNVVFKPQLEYGTTKTDYEAPIGDITALKVIQKNADAEVVAEYTPKSDGTVDGVTSLYPTTVITTDKGTVPIECEYNRDMNKAITKLYRHTIKASANYRETTPGGEIDGYDPLFSSLTLVVYRTTETPLTITDISNEEMRTASIKDFQTYDAPDTYRAPLFAEKDGTGIKIRYVNGFTTDSGGNLSVLSTASVTLTKYNFTDTVSEV